MTDPDHGTRINTVTGEREDITVALRARYGGGVVQPDDISRIAHDEIMRLRRELEAARHIDPDAEPIPPALLRGWIDRHNRLAGEYDRVAATLADTRLWLEWMTILFVSEREYARVMASKNPGSTERGANIRRYIETLKGCFESIRACRRRSTPVAEKVNRTMAMEVAGRLADLCHIPKANHV